MQDYGLQDLTNASLRFSEAAANYGALKVIFGVFLVVVLLMCVLFFYQIWNTQKRLGVIEEASDKTLRFFSSLNNRTIGKEEAKSIVCESLRSSEALVKYYILKIHIESATMDAEFIDDKVRSLVENFEATRQAFLSRFICCNKQVNLTVEIDSLDNENVVHIMKEWIYRENDKFTVALMAQAVEIYFDGIKIKSQNKIENL